MTDLASLASLDAEIYTELGAAGWVSTATHRARGATATTAVQAMISAGYQVAGEWVQLGAQTRTARLLRSQIVASAGDELTVGEQRYRMTRVLSDDGSAVVWQIDDIAAGDIP